MWLVAATQAGLGHDVTLFIHEDSTARARALSRETGLTLRRSHRELAGLIARSPLAGAERPDVVHFHSVFIPSHATLALSLRHRHIPYVVTPHGGLSKQILERHGPAKRLYAKSIERARIKGAAAVTAVHTGEVAELVRFLGRGAPPISVVGNPIDAALFGSARWSPTPPPPHLVFLGRYDVQHKGLDRLVTLAEHLPDVQIRLYGVAPEPSDREYQGVVARAPRNMSINGPLFGSSKVDVLASASMYIQLSRWEGHSIYLAEALYLGVPVAVSAHTNMATDVGQYDLGIVLPDDPRRAAAEVRAALHDEARLRARSENATAFARRQYDPKAVASAYVHVYDSVTEAVDPVTGSGSGSDSSAA
jgi:glycosyltransferase involved in cell wall biosynthesis